MNSCVFCSEGSDFSFAKKEYLHQCWPYDNRVVYSNDVVFAVVGMSPQTSPYIIIIPYRHIYSLAEMNEKELSSFYNCLAFLYSSGAFHSSLCLFEHGGKAFDGSSSIDHCHIHVIDDGIDFFDNPSFSGFHSVQDVSCLKELLPAYFLLGKYDGDSLFLKASVDSVHEHQYFRRVLAAVLGEEEWDWKLNMRYEKMLEIMKTFIHE